MGSEVIGLVSDNCDSEPGWTEEDDDIPMMGTGMDDEGCKFLIEELVGEAIVVLCDDISYNPDTGHVKLDFDTSKLPAISLQALGLGNVITIVLELIFEYTHFAAGSAPRCDVSYIKREAPPVEPEPEPDPETVDETAPHLTEPPEKQEEEVYILDDLTAPSENAQSSTDDSEDEDPMRVPKYKRPKPSSVAYQFSNIARKKLADDWPAAKLMVWREAKEWIPQLHQYLSARLITLGNHCVICDDKQPMPGIKPVACSNYLCSHQFDEMGYGASLDMIYHSPTVADLLISMAAAAVCNPEPRHRQRFFACPNPPSDFVDDHAIHRRQGIVADPNNTMGIKWSELQQVLEGLPSVERMAAAKNLQNFLDKFHKHAYRLVRWILSTCRGHIVQLQPDEQIPGMGGHQFKLFTNTFERELAFQKLKQQQGSFYVFHGSPFMKWHSILRTCLQTFSNTPFMSCGAASGPGVYTASCAATSIAYCKIAAAPPTSGYRASLFGAGASCLALVEAADRKDAMSKINSIHVVRNHDAVVARYFFVYSNSHELPHSMDTNRMNIPAWDIPCSAAV